MKIRTGFVSNSSSSSFICNLCGEDYSGYDACLEDADMRTCGEHIFCTSHMKKVFDPDSMTLEQKIQLLKDFYGDNLTYKELLEIQTEEDWEENQQSEIFEDVCEDMKSELPEEFCPICSFDRIDNSTEVKYYRKILNVTSWQTAKELKAKFTSYGEFKEFVK